MPRSDNLSFKPRTNGISGPMKTISAFISFANLHCPSMSSAATGEHSANASIPGLPGATINFLANGDLDNE